MEQLTRDSFVENGVKYAGVSSPTSIEAEKNIKSIVEKDGKFTYKTDDNVEHEVSVDTSNLVTTDTNQTITGDKDFAGELKKILKSRNSIFINSKNVPAPPAGDLNFSCSICNTQRKFVVGSGTKAYFYFIDFNNNIKFFKEENFNSQVIGVFTDDVYFYILEIDKKLSIFDVSYEKLNTQKILNLDISSYPVNMVYNDDYVIFTEYRNIECLDKSNNFNQNPLYSFDGMWKKTIVNNNNNFYIFGENYKAQFDPATNTVINEETINGIQRCNSSVSYNNIVYIAGRKDDGFISIQKFDMNTNSLLAEVYNLESVSPFTDIIDLKISLDGNMLYALSRYRDLYNIELNTDIKNSYSSIPLNDVGEVWSIFVYENVLLYGSRRTYNEFIAGEIRKLEFSASCDILNESDKDELKAEINKKQNKLIAGKNIIIENDVISADNVVTTDTEQTITGDKTFIDIKQKNYYNPIELENSKAYTYPPVCICADKGAFENRKRIYVSSLSRFDVFDGKDVETKKALPEKPLYSITNSENQKVDGLKVIDNYLYVALRNKKLLLYDISKDGEPVYFTEIDVSFLQFNSDYDNTPKIISNGEFTICQRGDKFVCIENKSFSVLYNVSMPQKAITIYNNKFYVFGENYKAEYDPSTNTFINVVEATGISGYSMQTRGCVVDKNGIAYISGINASDKYVMYIYKYDLVNDMLLPDKYTLNSGNIAFARVSDILINKNILLVKTVSTRGLVSIIDLVDNVVYCKYAEENYIYYDVDVFGDSFIGGKNTKRGKPTTGNNVVLIEAGKANGFLPESYKNNIEKLETEKQNKLTAKDNIELDVDGNISAINEWLSANITFDKINSNSLIGSALKYKNYIYVLSNGLLKINRINGEETVIKTSSVIKLGSMLTIYGNILCAIYSQRRQPSVITLINLDNDTEIVTLTSPTNAVFIGNRDNLLYFAGLSMYSVDITSPKPDFVELFKLPFEAYRGSCTDKSFYITDTYNVAVIDDLGNILETIVFAEIIKNIFIDTKNNNNYYVLCQVGLNSTIYKNGNTEKIYQGNVSFIDEKYKFLSYINNIGYIVINGDSENYYSIFNLETKTMTRIAKREYTERIISNCYDNNRIYVDGTDGLYEMEFNNDKTDIYNNIEVNTFTPNDNQELLTAGYNFKADITIIGVTEKRFANVVFGIVEALSGNYAPIVDTSLNTITIYSKVDTPITIPTIWLN